MSYSYFCVDCGSKHQGQDVVFSLSRMLGLERRKNSQSTSDIIHQSVDFNDPLMLYVSWKTLCSYARASGIMYLEDKKAARIRITLKDLMELYAENGETDDVRNKIRGMGIKDTLDAKFIMDLERGSGQNEAVIQQEAKEIGRRLRETFSKKESAIEESMDKEKTEYFREILIFPEFMEGSDRGDEIYTVRYSMDLSNERKMESFSYAGEEIRGYCPKCHAPVLKGTGKYRHLPIGFIGGPRAGKTSLIVAMFSELLMKPKNFPEAVRLADSKIENLKRQVMLYSKGWKVEKSQQESVRDSFNASVWVQNQGRGGKYVIFTLVDIAGELCLNEQGLFDQSAVRKYPLIDQCSLYLLCTCISDAGFRVDGGNGGIGAGVSSIVSGIADCFDRRGEYFPPLGIVLTKADYVKTVENTEHVMNNPFHGIVCKAEYFIKGKEMLARLGRIYEMYNNDEDYIKPLSWVCKLFRDYHDKTYLSMFYCSATGMTAETYQGERGEAEKIKQNVDSEGRKIQFKSTNVDTLLWWILQVTGCVPVEESENYCCFDIPLYGEGFAADKIKNSWKIRQEWPWEQWKDRNDAICTLFLNQSELDSRFDKNLRADREDSPILRVIKKFVGCTGENKNLREVKKYIGK